MKGLHQIKNNNNNNNIYTWENPQLSITPNTDTLLYLSIYKRYQKIIFSQTVSNLILNKNKCFVFQNIQFSNYYFIKCNILVLIFIYLNNNFFKSL